jgi:hypothetical protein
MGRIGSRVAAIAFLIGWIGPAGPAAFAETAKPPAAPAKQASPATRSPSPAAQGKPSGSRNARLYFLREKGILGAMGGLAATTEVLIDGKSAGKVDMGTFFVVERPPGVHKIATHMKLSITDYEIEVPVEAGKTYYFGIGTPRTGPPVQDLLNQAIAGSSGQQIRSSSPFKSAFAGASLFRLEPAAGAAAIEKLKQP